MVKKRVEVGFWAKTRKVFGVIFDEWERFIGRRFWYLAVVMIFCIGVVIFGGANQAYATGASLSITPSAQSLKIEASGSGFAMGSVHFRVVTDSNAGYTLTIQDKNKDNSLRHENSSIDARFEALSVGTVNKANFPAGFWGYSLDDDVYTAIPKKGEARQIKKTNTATTGDNIPLYFGVRPNPGMASGKYKGTIVLTAIANEVQTTFDGIVNMQEMTGEVCERETTPYAFEDGASFGEIVKRTTKRHSDDKNLIPEAELIDTRDGKKYVVRKFADGNCWMVQNLDLGDTAVELTAENTDLNGVPGFTLSAAQTVPSSWGNWQNDADYDVIRSYNNGDKWFLFNGDRLRDVMTQVEPNSLERKIRHVGNYYNWYTATAQSGRRIMGESQVASSSICPKGWGLPMIEGDRSYKNLTEDVYRIAPKGYSITEGFKETEHLRKKPFSFPASGFFHASGNISNQSGDGFYWTAVGYDVNAKNAWAQRLFAGTEFGLTKEYSKIYGNSVRCVARRAKAFEGITKMQEMTKEICAAETTPNKSAVETTRLRVKDKNLIPETELLDVRDNKKYKIRKLADGNCWMVGNLNLSLNTAQTLTPENTDVMSSWTPPRNTQDYNSNEYWAGTDLGRSKQGLDDNGVYYSWNAVTAGTGRYDDSDGKVALGSVCPKGWKLPNAGGDGSVYNLGLYYNGQNQMMNGGAKFLLAGYYSYSGVIKSVGLTGYYWSNRMIDAESRKVGVSYFYTNNNKLDHMDELNFGFSARCVVAVDKNPDEISYMQEMTPQICEKMSEHQVLNLIDFRNGKQYGVKKIKNGACWMMDNLEVVLNRSQKFSYGGTDVLKTWTPTRDTEVTSDGLPNWNNEGVYQSDRENSYIEDNPANHGVYYNWNVATAGEGKTGFVALDGEQKAAKTSICPSGWQLPSAGGGKNSYLGMKASYNDVFNDGPQLVRAGYYSIGAGGLHSVGNSAYYWTNTTKSEYSEGRISALTFTGSDNYSNQPRKYGFSIRCVVREE